MDPISIAAAILGVLHTTGLDSKILSGLGGMLFGDKGKEIAGKVIDGATKTFNTTDPAAIQAQIAADKTKADQFIARLQEDTKQYQIEVDDRKDARARDLRIRELELTLAAKQGTDEVPWWRQNARANIMIALAFAYAIGGMAFVFIFIEDLSKPGSVAVLTFLTTSMGNVLGMLGTAFNFEFGSSRGSSAKDDTISKALGTSGTGK